MEVEPPQLKFDLTIGGKVLHLQALNSGDYERWLNALLPLCTDPLRQSGSGTLSEAWLASTNLMDERPH